MIAHANYSVPVPAVNDYIPINYNYARVDSHPEPIVYQEIIHQSDAGKLVEESVYWDQYYENKDFRYEWNNGILEVKEMPTFLCMCCADFFKRMIEQYLSVNSIAQLVWLDMAFSITMDGKSMIRKPDLAIILNTNPFQPDDFDRSYKGTYDICIEFLSDSKKDYVLKDTIYRKQEYCAASVKEYYIIDDKNINTAFYRLNSQGDYEPIPQKNGIITSTVLPGFRFRVQDIYNRPDFKELMKLDVYKEYMLVDYLKQCEETEKERKAKEKERKAKEKERKAKEKEREEKERVIQENKRLLQIIQKMGITE